MRAPGLGLRSAAAVSWCASWCNNVRVQQERRFSACTPISLLTHASRQFSAQGNAGGASRQRREVALTFTWDGVRLGSPCLHTLRLVDQPCHGCIHQPSFAQQLQRALHDRCMVKVCMPPAAMLVSGVNLRSAGVKLRVHCCNPARSRPSAGRQVAKSRRANSADLQVLGAERSVLNAVVNAGC